MQAFADTKGHEWSIDVTVGAVRRVRDATGILLTAMYENRCALMEKLAGDVVLFVDVLWAICKPQAGETTPEQFAEAMGGNSLAAAMEALVRATADFFTSQEQRDAFQKINSAILETAKETTQQAAKIVTEAMEQINPSQVATNYLDSVTSGQESPESTQALALTVS